MKLIIATDGSKIGNRAADYGIKFAKIMNAEVSGIYVISEKSLEIHAQEYGKDAGGREAEIARYRKDGEKLLAGLASKCAEAGVKASTVMAQGYPADEILRLAETEKADMIVLGNLGKTNLEYMFMGSVSESVIRKAPCPVLVVRGDMQL